MESLTFEKFLFSPVKGLSNETAPWSVCYPPFISLADSLNFFLMAAVTTSEPALPPATAKPRVFGRVFWTLNTIEMWERLAFFNLRVMAPIYIMQADNPGGLHLTAADKGTIYAWWAAFQSLLPIVTGGYADRFGYKRTLAFAISMMMAGFFMIAFMRDVSFASNYWGFFAGILVLATGTAFFKPSIQGSLAHNL